MDDPVYESGVTSKSIVSMMSDVSNALAGRLSHISTPIPLDGRPPTSYISFSNSIETPAPLSFSESKVQSRRVYNYSLRNASEDYNTRHYGADRDSIVLSMDEVLDGFNEMMHEENIEETHDDIVDDVHHKTPVKEDPIPIPSRSRRRRVVPDS